MLLSKDLINYKNYKKSQIKDGVSYHYEIGDLVKISEDITANIGYRGQLEIIQNYSGVSNYLYVMAYDTRANRYWVCGFNEADLKVPNIFEILNIEQLSGAFCDWTMKNNIIHESCFFD